MATYLQGVTDYIPQIQPFAPDINLYANVLQTKQSKYDANWQSLNNVYSQYFYADLSREDNQERRDELMKAIDGNLKKVSGLDLSLEQNVRQAKQLFTPFYEDKYLMRDMVYTKSYKQEMDRALSAKNCVGKDCEGTYWDGGVELLNYQLDKFKKAGLEESLNVATPSYVPYFDIMKEANELVKKYNYEIVMDSSQGGYMVREKNGPNAIGSLNDFILQNFMNNPRAADFYRAQAQLSYYKDPDKAYQKYKALNNLPSSPEADAAVRNQIQDAENENVLNETKFLFSTIANKTDDEIKNLEYQKLLLEKRKEMFGDGWEESNEAKDLNAVNIDLENKKGLQSQIDPLNNQIQSIQYKDKDGKPLSEEQLVGTVAMGLLMGDALNTAQSIAMNKYSRTVTGADPYALARYKAQMKAMYSTGSGGSGGSGGSSGSPKPTASEKIVADSLKEADAYVKSDEGKDKVDDLKKQGNSETNAKRKIQLEQIEQKKKQLEQLSKTAGQQSVPLVEETLDKYENEIARLKTAIDKEESKSLIPTEKANVTVNYAALMGGQLVFEYTGKDGKKHSQKVGYQDVRNAYENQHDFVTSRAKTAIESAENTYLNGLSAKVTNLFQRSRGSNIHQEKAVNDYINTNKLKPETGESDADFTTRIYESLEFQRSLVEPFFNYEDDVIINPLIIKNARKEAEDMIKGDWRKASTARRIITKAVEQAKTATPNDKTRTAYLESLKAIGFTEKDLIELQTSYATVDGQKERFFRFNEANKSALNFHGQRWLKTNDLKKDELPDNIRFYLDVSQGINIEKLGANIKDNFKKWIFYRNPTIRNKDGEIKINDAFNPVRSLINDFIKEDGTVDKNLKRAIDAYSNYVVDEKSRKVIIPDSDFVAPKYFLSDNQITALTKAGYYKNGKVLKFFNDIVPDKELMRDLTLDMMKALNSTGSRGNIFMLNPNSSDWAISAKTVASDFEKVTEASYIPKITNVLEWASKYVTGNDEALNSIFKREGKVGSYTFTPLYIDGKPVDFDKSKEELSILNNLLTDKELNKLFNISAEFHTYSEHANDYSKVTYRIIPTDPSKNKETLKEYSKYTKKDITVHFPTKEDPSLDAAKNQDFLSKTIPGTKYRSPDGYTTITVTDIRDGELVLNISDIYFENGKGKILNAEEPLPMTYIKNWNETISNILIEHSKNRKFKNI